MKAPLLLPLALLCLSAPPLDAQRARQRALSLPEPSSYTVDFVSTAAFGTDLNTAGDVIGRSYRDVGCGPFCLPPQETVVWHDGERIVLPMLPGWTGVTVRAINDAGWIVGEAGQRSSTRAALWRPTATGYEAVDLGVLPGKTISTAIGVDDLGRVIGWSTTAFFPPSTAPFLWTESGGLVDLSLLGYPNEMPIDLSPGGTVALSSSWYRLGDPASVTTLPPVPSGFLLTSSPAAINDAGDQARFLVTSGSQSLVYLYRYRWANDAWQRLSDVPTGHLTTYGVGSIDRHGTVTATVGGTGVIAYGPDGLAQSLGALLADPWVYPDRASTPVTKGGPINRRGEVLAEVLLGRSKRLVVLKPEAPCPAPCVHVDDLSMVARFVPDPGAPGSCSPSFEAFDEVLVTLRVLDAGGFPVPGAEVTGRFLDDYWTNAPMTATTNVAGQASFFYVGPCGVGALEFLVDGVEHPGTALDPSLGQLSVWQIPS